MLEILGWVFGDILLFSSMLYMLPFIAPSTILLAGAFAAIYPSYSPLYLGVAVAAGASIAKTVTYLLSFFAGKALGNGRIDRLHRNCSVVGRWRTLTVFLASATPIPDEPILICLGLVRYSPLRVSVAFLAGKLVSTIPAAYVGKILGLELSKTLGNIPLAILSAVFSILVTVLLVKVDVGELWAKYVQIRTCQTVS